MGVVVPTGMVVVLMEAVAVLTGEAVIQIIIEWGNLFR